MEAVVTTGGVGGAQLRGVWGSSLGGAHQQGWWTWVTVRFTLEKPYSGPQSDTWLSLCIDLSPDAKPMGIGHISISSLSSWLLWEVVTANFMCQLDSATGVPDTWSNVIPGGYVRVFLDEVTV